MQQSPVLRGPYTALVRVRRLGTHFQLVDWCNYVLLVIAAALYIPFIYVDSWEGPYSTYSRLLSEICNEITGIEIVSSHNDVLLRSKLSRGESRTITACWPGRNALGHYTTDAIWSDAAFTPRGNNNGCRIEVDNWWKAFAHPALGNIAIGMLWHIYLRKFGRW